MSTQWNRNLGSGAQALSGYSPLTMYPPGLSPKRPWTELDHPWLSKHISLVDHPKLNAQRGRGKANRWGGWLPNATKAALAAATEFQSPVRWRHFWTSEQPSLLSPLLLLFPLMIPHHIFHVKRLYVSFTLYQTHETCTCYKCNRFSQMTRQPLNRNKKVTSPPECAFARRNLRKVKGESSGNPSCDGSPAHLPLTERNQRSNPN